MPEGVEPAATFHMTGPPQDVSPDIPFVRISSPAFPAASLTDFCSKPNPKVIGQSHLEELIRIHLARLGVHVELGKELVEFKQDESGIVATTLNRGVEGEHKETIVADYIVSAEGGRSKSTDIEFIDSVGDRRRNRYRAEAARHVFLGRDTRRPALSYYRYVCEGPQQ